MRIDSSVNALNAISVSQQVTANNIANVNTEGFSPSRAELETTAEGRGPQVAQITEAPPPPPLPEQSGVDLGRESVNLIRNQRAYEANAAAIRTADEMSGTVLDIVT